MDMVKKGFGNEPLKDFTMERKRVEEFEESLMQLGWPTTESPKQDNTVFEIFQFL